MLDEMKFLKPFDLAKVFVVLENGKLNRKVSPASGPPLLVLLKKGTIEVFKTIKITIDGLSYFIHSSDEAIPSNGKRKKTTNRDIMKLISIAIFSSI